MNDDFDPPDGWVVKPLSAVAQVVKDKIEPAAVPDAHYIGLEHVEAHTMRLLGRGRGSDVRSAKTVFLAGDVLYGKLRPYLNKVTRPPFDGISSTDFLVLRETGDLDAGYLAQFLNQLSVADRAHHLSTGVELPRVDWKFLSTLPVPFPVSKVEQRTIVTKIERARALSDGADDRLARVRKTLERLRRALLAAACSGRLTAAWRSSNSVGSGEELVGRVTEQRRSHLGARFEDDSPAVTDDMPEIPESWSWASLGSLCEPDRVITYGVIKLGPQADDGVPILRSSDIRWLRIDDSSVKRISREIADDYKRTYLRGGEVLVTVRGTLGGVAVAPLEMAGWNVSREVAVIPVSPNIDANYCMLAIGNMRSQSWLGGVAKGVAYTGVNIEDLRKLPLPIPPLAEQREIVRRASELLSRADRLLARLDDTVRLIERSSQSVLAKAFRGELMPA